MVASEPITALRRSLSIHIQSVSRALWSRGAFRAKKTSREKLVYRLAAVEDGREKMAVSVFLYNIMFM